MTLGSDYDPFTEVHSAENRFQYRDSLCLMNRLVDMVSMVICYNRPSVLALAHKLEQISVQEHEQAAQYRALQAAAAAFAVSTSSQVGWTQSGTLASYARKISHIGHEAS